MTTRLWVALLVAAATQACAQQDGVVATASSSSAPFSKSQWRVAAVSCPIGCSDATRTFLASQVGASVTLAPTRLAAPWDDPCEGTLRYDVHAVPAESIVADVNKGVAPSHRQMTPADLGLAAGATTTSAVALCRGAKGETTQQRLLSIAPDRVLVLFEEQSVIELR